MAALSVSVRANKPLAAVMRAMQTIEAPKPRTANGVFLAIDLTLDVASELLSEKNKGVSVAVIYHPTIFRGLKSLTLSNSQQQSLLRCAAEGISIYCPHTSLDATPGGINDWLALNALSASSTQAPPSGRSTEQVLTSTHLQHQWAQIPDVFSKALFQGLPKNLVKPLQPSDNVASEKATSEGWTGAGMGRKLTLSALNAEPSLGDFVSGFKREMGVQHAQLAYGRGASLDSKIKTVAVCAGSGSSVLKGADVDLWITGELSHHELLATTESGPTSVLLLRHSASERGFLRDILARRIDAILSMPGEEDSESGPWSVVVSEQDRDPLVFV
ncbi:hypothetical protein OC846_006013 [Tilletia horrida]|uniref:YbgI/family dinuclear metal center protein n=1 Tax=Tilletia horrida TaxID=155126 RepID=A0AAN6GJN7_9BASI|nr:hypothetical protein OC846_006013 [Tilletia horrida]KAK0554602.1 hypothetical protein OC845_000634 [Tilletia horrida]KAK0562178.1 hypothetical protein OC861_005449 [Tilletia horrida]